jgi:regulator of sirC expression with transglutaminase-like and TPR domain
MKESDLQALIRLLEDPDEDIFRTVSKKLNDEGEAVVPMLEKAWEEATEERIQYRIEALIQDIQFSHTSEKLLEWKETEERDLLKGCLIIARFQYPDLDEEKVHEQIDKIARDIWIELHDDLTALEKVRVINHILYSVYGFSGNPTNFYSPQNNFINSVLETKKGNPLTLSIVYSIVAQKIQLPVFGVNLPKNFILAYRDDYRSQETFDPEINDHILFYINPYSKGAVLGKEELVEFLNQQKIKPRRDYFVPCNNILIIERLLNNLIFAYNKLGYQEKVVLLERLLKVLE